MEFKFEKFVLRKLKLTDKNDYIKNINDADVLKLMGGEYPYNPEKFDKLFTSKNFISFAIEINNEVVGEVGLTILERKIQNHIGVIGYWLAKRYWGDGIITKAIKCVCDYAFKEIKLKKITAEVFTENIASVRVLEKNNFICEGILKKHAFKNNKFYDIAYYSKFYEQ